MSKQALLDLLSDLDAIASNRRRADRELEVEVRILDTKLSKTNPDLFSSRSSSADRSIQS
jgi:hypothetical protein